MKTNVLYSYYPAQWHRNLWREGFVAGNGRTGINVLGAVQHETVILNRGDLWTGLKKAPLPDVSDALKQMRELRKKGQFLQADRAICDALVQKGYKASCSVPLPLGQLDIVREKGGIFENYLRSLDMDSGEICVRWKSEGNAFERRYFVDRTGKARDHAQCARPRSRRLRGDSRCRKQDFAREKHSKYRRALRSKQSGVIEV